MYHLTSCDNFNYVVGIRTIHHETFEVSNLVVLREPQVVRVETSIMLPLFFKKRNVRNAGEVALKKKGCCEVGVAGAAAAVSISLYSGSVKVC